MTVQFSRIIFYFGPFFYLYFFLSIKHFYFWWWQHPWCGSKVAPRHLYIPLWDVFHCFATVLASDRTSVSIFHVQVQPIGSFLKWMCPYTLHISWFGYHFFTSLCLCPFYNYRFIMRWVSNLLLCSALQDIGNGMSCLHIFFSVLLYFVRIFVLPLSLYHICYVGM